MTMLHQPPGHRAFLSLILIGLSIQSGYAFFTVDCGIVTVERSDPIVSPGRPSGHTHVVAGSKAFGQSSSNDDLRAATCTSCDVRQDKSAYWVPQLYVVPPGLRDFRHDAIIAAGGVPVPARTIVVYYKLIGYAGERSSNDRSAPGWEDIVPFPPNFRLLVTEGMVLDKTLTTRNNFDRPLSYKCLGGPNQNADTPSFPPDPAACKNGIRLQLTFPSCWDGVNPTAPDHMSHTSYPVGSWAGSHCPASHPTRVPTLFLEVIVNPVRVADKLAAGWRLRFPHVPGQFTPDSDGGHPLFHADFMNGWGQQFLQSAINECGITPCAFVAKAPSTCKKGTTQSSTPSVPPPTVPARPPPSPAAPPSPLLAVAPSSPYCGAGLCVCYNTLNPPACYSSSQYKCVDSTRLLPGAEPSGACPIGTTRPPDTPPAPSEPSAPAPQLPANPAEPSTSSPYCGAGLCVCYNTLNPPACYSPSQYKCVDSTRLLPGIEPSGTCPPTTVRPASLP